MKDSPGPLVGFCLGVAVTLVIALPIGDLIGASIERHKLREEAIKANAAHYYLDGDNQKQFKWGAKP